MKRFSTKIVSLLYLVAVVLMMVIGSIVEVIRANYPVTKEFVSSMFVKTNKFLSLHFGTSSRGLSTT